MGSDVDRNEVGRLYQGAVVPRPRRDWRGEAERWQHYALIAIMAALVEGVALVGMAVKIGVEK